VDGVNWATVSSQDTAGWAEGAFTGLVKAGLSVSSHNGGVTCDVVFTNYQETSAVFCLGSADSQGCPDKITVTFNRPVGASALDAKQLRFGGWLSSSRRHVQAGSRLPTV